MASQKVQEMVILAEQGNGLFRPLIFSLLSFQFYILLFSFNVDLEFAMF